MLFVDSAPNFINPARVSPVRLSTQVTSGPSSTRRLLVDGRIATCISAVFCSESVVITAEKIGQKSERTRKWVSGLFHNQDWERFESLICLVFGEDTMYAQINSRKAVAFQTMISPEPSAGVKGRVFLVDLLLDLLNKNRSRGCRPAVQQGCTGRYVQPHRAETPQSSEI
jgi:hypothetical protein